MQKIDLLKWLLRAHAVMLLLAIVPIFFPYSAMNAIHEMLGLGELPFTPITEYLTRSLSLVYALHGAVCLVITFDMKKYLPLMKTIAGFHFLFGLFSTGIDLHSKLPTYWIIGEGPMISIFAIFVYFFAGHCIAESQVSEESKSTSTGST